MSILSAKKAYSNALSKGQKSDLNTLHERAYHLIQKQQLKHYEERVNTFLKTITLPRNTKTILKNKMLQPITAGGVQYSNFMEEAARRLSQSTQTTSGRIAERCVQRELERKGLRKEQHFTVRKHHADIIVYYPDIKAEQKRHRIEVKNVKMRERGVRGFSYDGDSLIGFFDSEDEFGIGAIAELEKLCHQKGGYVYVPPKLFISLKKKERLKKNSRVRRNTAFGQDMANFSKTGKL